MRLNLESRVWPCGRLRQHGGRARLVPGSGRHRSATWSDLRGRVDGDVGDRPNRVAGSAPLATRSENDCSGSRWGPISRSARAIQHACKRDYIRHIRTGCGFLQGNGARRISSGQVRSILLPDLLSHAEGSPVGIQVGGDRAPSGARPACLRCGIGVPCGQNAGCIQLERCCGELSAESSRASRFHSRFEAWGVHSSLLSGIRAWAPDLAGPGDRCRCSSGMARSQLLARPRRDSKLFRPNAKSTSDQAFRGWSGSNWTQNPRC